MLREGAASPKQTGLAALGPLPNLAALDSTSPTLRVGEVTGTNHVFCLSIFCQSCSSRCDIFRPFEADAVWQSPWQFDKLHGSESCTFIERMFHMQSKYFSAAILGLFVAGTTFVMAADKPKLDGVNV